MESCSLLLLQGSTYPGLGVCRDMSDTSLDTLSRSLLEDSTVASHFCDAQRPFVFKVSSPATSLSLLSLLSPLSSLSLSVVSLSLSRFLCRLSVSFWLFLMYMSDC